MRAVRTIITGVAIAALVATGCEWNFETLDGHQNGPNGQDADKAGADQAALLYNGRPHVFYRSDPDGAAGNDDLRHGYWNGSFWAFETLDGAGGPNGRVNSFVGDYISAVLYNGRPHVFYYDVNNGNLRHAYYNGVSWAFESLDGAGGPNGRLNGNVGEYTVALLYQGRPHVFYRDITNKDLRHGYWNGVFWDFETLDGHMNGPNGRIDADVQNGNGSVIVYNLRPHVFYKDGTNGNLRHAYYNGSVWVFETLDGHQTGPTGQIDANVGNASQVVLYKGRPHVFYSGATNLRHGYWNGVAWAFETLDGMGGPNGRITGNIGGTQTSAILYGGKPRVFYHDNTTNTLRLAYFTGTAWGFETLDGLGGGNGRVTAGVGNFSTAVLYNNRPHVFYQDSTNHDLRHAYFG